ncbi:CBS domain-containing protein [Saprospiraceae bacterium]|nr:CBS domain-containing protein [Saprospiraceae bacterium]
MNLFQQVSTLMTTQLMTLPPSASIAEAALIFEKHGIHHIPITQGKKMIGIISKTDYLFFRRGFFESEDDQRQDEIRMHNYDVSYIMTKGIGKLEPTDKIVLALDIFRKNEFHALPVVENDELVGLVTTHDIIERLAIDNEATAEYER